MTMETGAEASEWTACVRHYGIDNFSSSILTNGQIVL